MAEADAVRAKAERESSKTRTKMEALAKIEEPQIELLSKSNQDDRRQSIPQN